MPSPRTNRVIVFGAYGHTARFVIAELHRRGLEPVLAGRNADRLAKVGRPEWTRHVTTVDDQAALDELAAGAAVLVNCAGPFADTTIPLVDAALRAGAHYVDVSAEQAITAEVFTTRDDRASEADVVVIPSLAFYGGIGDLLATAAIGDWPDADEIRIGIALDSWQPTRGTRLTVRRNAGRHLVHTGGRLVRPPVDTATGSWEFGDPFGTLPVTELSTADQVTIPRHLHVPEVRVFMNDTPLDDLRDPATPPPVPADTSGRSAQTFRTEVRVRRGTHERQASAAGRDIYAVTAPLVAEAVDRLLTGRYRATGALPAGAAFDALSLLNDLTPEHLTFTAPTGVTS